MGLKVQLLERLTKLGLKNSICALYYAIIPTHRSHTHRVGWQFLLITCFLFCLNYQTQFLHTVIVKKPTLVENTFQRKSSFYFPNVVVCDMGQERDKILQFLNPTTGNSGELSMFLMQVAMLDLYEAARRSIRENVTASMAKYPYLAEQYRRYSQMVDPQWLISLSQKPFFQTH